MEIEYEVVASSEVRCADCSADIHEDDSLGVIDFGNPYDDVPIFSVCRDCFKERIERAKDVVHRMECHLEEHEDEQSEGGVE